MADAADDDLFSQVSAVASDALYVAVGFGVLGFQRLQVRRRELEAQLQRLGAAVADVRQLVK